MNITTSSPLPINEEFSLLDDIFYLNHAAIAPWPNRVVHAVEKFSRENAAQGSKYYPRWVETEMQLRQQIQQLINAKSPDDIALLKNTSEALSVVAFGLEWQAGENIVSVTGEFPSNRVVWEALSTKGVTLRKADIHCDDPEQALFNQVDAHTRLIAVSSVQYATGYQLNLVRIGEFCRQNKILFCVDAIQSIGALQFDVQAIQADFVMADGHKWMLGPEGLALFYCRAERRDQLKLHQYGWHMVEAVGDYDTKTWAPATSARRFECGSPNMLAIHALSAALKLILETGVASIERQLLQRSEHMMKIINKHPRLTLLSPTEKGRYGGIVTFRAEGVDQQSLYQQLMKDNVICAQRGDGVRFSPHFYTPLAQLDQAFEKVHTIIS